MENNQRLLLIIRKNGLQVLTKDEQQYFWDNLNEFRKDVWTMSQFLQSVEISEVENNAKHVLFYL